MAKRMCTIDGCVKPHTARGFCPMHYYRWKTHGDPGPAAPSRILGRTGCDVVGCRAPHKANGMCERHRQNARSFGLTAADLSALNDTCPVCGAHATHIDHCHGCDAVRGRLCHGCNAGNGITDDPDLLERKAKWLREACSCHG